MAEREGCANYHRCRNMGIQWADPKDAELKKRSTSCHGLHCIYRQCFFIDLIHISNKESHKAAADQGHHRRCDHHDDDAPRYVDQQAQATSDQDLGQLDHAGEGSTVQALPSPAAIQAPSPGLLLLQGKHRNST